MVNGYDPQTLTLLRKVVSGVFYSGEHTSHWAETVQCRHCGASDTVSHRLEECPATVAARASMPPGWLQWPRHLRQFLLPSRAQQVWPLFRSRLAAAAPPVSPQERYEGTCHIFTDGSCIPGIHPDLAKAGWAFTLWTGTSSLSMWASPAVVQSASRAEVYAVLQALVWARQAQVRIELWTDCQPCLTRITQLLAGLRHGPTRDLWSKIAVQDLLACLADARKVHSHLREDTLEPGALWAAKANQAVDLSAKLAAREWLPGEAGPWHQCHTVAYAHVAGFHPPPWLARHRRWITRSRLTQFPQVNCEVKAIHDSLKILVTPVLRELDWPPVPARLTRRHPLIRVPLGMVAWRLPPTLQDSVSFTLSQWSAAQTTALIQDPHRPVVTPWQTPPCHPPIDAKVYNIR